MTSHKDAITNLLSSYSGVTTLFLEDIVRDVDIGVHDFEIGNPQKVRFEIYVMMSDIQNPNNDDLSEVLNYEYLIDSLNNVLSLGRYSLLETLANRLLEEVSAPTSVKAASVVITKLEILDGDGRLGLSLIHI